MGVGAYKLKKEEVLMGKREKLGTRELGIASQKEGRGSGHRRK